MIIYVLSDPNTNQLRYVGKTTTTLSKRLSRHLSNSALQKRTPLTCWLKSLKKDGLLPLSDIIETCESEEHLNETERFYIAYFRFVGADLVNSTDGGEGHSGFSPTEETRAKLSAAGKGRPFSPEHRAAISRSKKGKGNGLTGRKRPSEVRNKIQQTLRGHTVSKETRRKISTANGGRPVIDNTGCVFETPREADLFLGLKAGAVQTSIKRKGRCGGYIFTYLDKADQEK
jgi:group I intron endonuclease